MATSGIQNIKNALTPEQIAFNRLPFDQQQGAIASGYNPNTAIVSGTPPQSQGIQNIQKSMGGTNISGMSKVTADNQYNFLKTPEQNATGTANNNFSVPSAPTAPPVGTPPTNNTQVYDPAKDPNTAKLQGMYDNQTKQFDQYKTDAAKRQSDTQAAYDAAREAKLAAVRQAIEASKSKFNTVIANAPQEFQNNRNANAAQGDLDNLQLRRSLGNMGYKPNEDLAAIREGDITNETNARKNMLDIAEKKTIQDAQNAITQLEAQGKMEEATTINDYATKTLSEIANQRNQLQQNLIAMQQNQNNDLKGLIDYTTGRKDKVDEANRLNDQMAFNQRLGSAELTGIDPKTGLPTADMQRFTKTFNSDEAKTLFNQAYQNKTFDYQKTRDAISDNQYDTRWVQELDNIAYSRSENNPAVKSQIINNAIADIEKLRMQDPNSAENQMRNIQVETAKKQLADLMAISPDMKVKEFNAGLDKIYQDIEASKANIRQGDRQLDIAQQNANTSASKGSGSGSQKQSPYFGAVSKDIDSFANNLNENGMSDRLSVPGSVEHKQFATTINNAMINGMITPSEGEYLYDYYNVPFSTNSGVQQQQYQQQPTQSIYMNKISPNNIPSNYQVGLTENPKRKQSGFGELNNLVR